MLIFKGYTLYEISFITFMIQLFRVMMNEVGRPRKSWLDVDKLVPLRAVKNFFIVMKYNKE